MAFGDRLRQGGLLGGVGGERGIDRLREGLGNIREQGADRLQGGADRLRGGVNRLREGLGDMRSGGGLLGLRGRRSGQAAAEAAAADAQDPSLTPTNEDVVASGMGAVGASPAGYTGSSTIPPEVAMDSGLLQLANGPNGKSFSPVRKRGEDGEYIPGGTYENPTTQAPKKSTIPAEAITSAVGGLASALTK